MCQSLTPTILPFAIVDEALLEEGCAFSWAKWATLENEQLQLWVRGKFVHCGGCTPGWAIVCSDNCSIMNISFILCICFICIFVLHA